MENWIEASSVNDIEREDVIRFDYGEKTLAIYRTEDSKFYATDGYCTHERFHLADGFVMGHTIECPKHNGRFDFTTGAAKRSPVCVDLKTYAVKVEGEKIFVKID